MDAIASKTSGQNIIDTYRQAVQDMHAWFESLIKKIDVLDKGSGLNCAQKLAAINEIKADFLDAGPNKLADLKQKAHQVTEIISNLDSQQIEEQLKSTDRRYNDISKRIDRKAQMLDATNKGVECARNEIEQVDNWVKRQIADLQAPQSIGFESTSAESRQQQLKALSKDAEAKQALAETLERRVSNMHNDLEPLEQTQLEGELRGVAANQKHLAELLKSQMASVGEAAQARKKLEGDIEKAKSWMKSKMNDIKKQSGHVPLQSATIEDEIQANRKIEGDIKNFAEGLIADVLKQGNNILKNCPEDEKTRLVALLSEIESDHASLKDEAAKKTSALASLLDGRKAYENDVAALNNWLGEAEISTTGDLRTTSLPILEEQLVKFESLGLESKEMGNLLASIVEQGKVISPALSNNGKAKLNEQNKTLKDRYGKTSANINDKIRALQDHIRKYKEAEAKLRECIQFLNGIQQEIRDLNKPVGSRIEDVQALLGAYERIHGELNQSKAKMGDIQIDNLPELQNILTQQDDMIRVIEDQLAHLRQLLLLREQFIALINEIVSFIMKYTSVITDIEKSPESIEEKIKQYDGVIVKIQECEALLASANDKGQKIASEGNAADRNSITEQLQSLKQQLQNLRKQVETQRQKHELTLAEHKKMAGDLHEVLDWLHANEANCKSRPLLDRDPDSVEREITKHKQFANDVLQHLAQIKTIDEQSQHDYGLPGSLVEMISEGRSLLATLPDDLNEREKYLEDSKKHRIEYINLVNKFKSWINEAEVRLQNGNHGIDFANIANDLEEHKQFFSNDATIKDLVHRQIQEAANKIWPSLQQSEQEDLTHEQQEHAQTLKNTQNAAKSQRAKLEKYMELWKEYCQQCDKVKNIIARSHVADEPVTNLAGLHFNKQKIAHALNDIQVSVILI